MPIPRNAHRGMRHLYCKCEISEYNNVDPCKRRLKVVLHRSLSCLLTLKPQSLSTEVLPEWIILQFKTIENVMQTICASHIDSLIVYEHFGGSGGETPNIKDFAWLIVIRLLQRAMGIRHYRTVTFKGALRYVSIGNFSCALYICGLLHCPYLSISTDAESYHANMTLAYSTDPNEM